MIKPNFLSTNLMFLSVVLNDKILYRYFDLVNDVIVKLDLLIIQRKINEILEDEFSHSTYKRLN